MRLFSAFASVVLLFATLQAQVPNYVPSDGLVGWWPFNGNANDESGNGNDGTVNGAILFTDRFGIANSAYSFDGLDDYIDFGNISQLNGLSQVSYNLWVKVNTSNQYSRILSKEEGSGPEGRGFNIKLSGLGDPAIENGLLGGNIRTTSVFPSSWTTFNPNTQSWHMVTLVFNGDLPASDRVQYYIDGQETMTTSFSVSSLFPTTTASFIAGGTGFYFDGVIDDIGAWTRPLTLSEIQDLYNSGQPLTPCISPTPVSFNGLNSSYMTSDTPAMLTGTPTGGLFIGPGVSGSTFDPASAGEGTHSVSYTYLDDDNCVNTYSLCTSVSLGMGLEPGGGAPSGVRVFPNPNRGQFTVELDLSGLVSLQVFDARGALVHNEVFTASGTRTQRSLDLGRLAKGSYAIQVQNNGSAITQQVLVE